MCSFYLSSYNATVILLGICHILQKAHSEADRLEKKTKNQRVLVIAQPVIK